MRDLVMPDALAGFEIDADDRIAEQVAAQPMAAIVVVGRSFDRQIGVAEFGIDRDRRPDAGVAGVGVGLVSSHVSAPNSPSFGTVWNDHFCLPVRASNAIT